MGKISAVIITHNEASNIRRCLLSLKDVADEIIVVDSFSTDGTPDICRSFGEVSVISREWLGFGPQKNLGIAAASFEYILSVDADEALDPVLTRALLEAKAGELSGMYQFSRLNYCYGKFLRHGAGYPDNKIRLFPKNQVRWNDDLVHEGLTITGDPGITRLGGRLLHYTYNGIYEHIRKANTYTTLAAKNGSLKGKRVSWFKIVAGPPFAFVQAYVLKGGFLDGPHGFVAAVIHAFVTFMKYVKLWELEKR